MTPPSENTATAADPIRVMVVDDSAVIRGFLTRFIETDPAAKVVASASNGQLAVNNVAPGKFDVIVLDIEMPVMDGITALPLILKADPHVQVIIASTLSKAGAAITLKALEIGAAECLAKPTAHELSGSTAFQDDLSQKVLALGMTARKRRGYVPKTAAPATGAPGTTAPAAAPKAPAPLKSFSLRRDIVPPAADVIAIGSSTGGPQALLQFFTDLKPGIKQPIFITQHMPPTFTSILAEHISKQSGLTCQEAKEGDVVEGGRIYLAPGNYHMTIKDNGGRKTITLNQDPPENFCRPSVDPMLRSLIQIYGKKILAVIFTGMGSDGLKSCQQLTASGGTVIAQDEATSVVWGMPGAVAMAGICSQVLPLKEMAKAVRDFASRGGAA